MFAVASNGLVGVIPLYNADTTTANFFVYNPSTEAFTTFEVPKNVVVASETAQFKHTLPAVSQELKDDTEVEKKAENKAPSVIVRALTFSKDNKYIIAATDGHMVLVYTVEDAKLVAYIPTSRKATVITVTPDNRFIIFGDRIGDVYAVKLELLVTGQPVEANLLYSQASIITTLDFLEVDGKCYFVSGDQEHKIRVSQYPDFFVIEACLMGHKSNITTATILPGATPRILSTSSITPTISHTVKGNVVSDSFQTHAVQLHLYNALTGALLAETRAQTPAAVAVANETNFLSQLAAAAQVKDTVYYLPAAIGVAKRPNSDQYSYGTTISVYGGLDTLMTAVVKDDKITVAAAETGDYDVAAHGNLISIAAANDGLVALTDKNHLLFLTVAPKVAVAKTVALAAPAVTKPVTLVNAEVQCRAVEAYLKHEVLFEKQQERIREKRRKRNDGLPVSDSEDEEDFE